MSTPTPLHRATALVPPQPIVTLFPAWHHVQLQASAGWVCSWFNGHGLGGFWSAPKAKDLKNKAPKKPSWALQFVSPCWRSLPQVCCQLYAKS